MSVRQSDSASTVKLPLTRGSEVSSSLAAAAAAAFSSPLKWSPFGKGGRGNFHTSDFPSVELSHFKRGVSCYLDDFFILPFYFYFHVCTLRPSDRSPTEAHTHCTVKL